MGQNYTVNYQINVRSEAAIESIRRFQEATLALDKLTTRYNRITRDTGKVVSALRALNSTTATVNVRTEQAEGALRRVIALLATIKAEAATVNGVVKGTQKNASGIPNASSLNDLNKKMAETHKAIDNLNKRYIHPKVRTKTAEDSLQNIINKLNTINGMKNVTITANVAGSAASGVNGGGTSSSKPSTKSAPKQPKQPKVKSKLQPGHSAYLYPTTRQVLGPTYAGSGTTIGGEMVKGMGMAYGLSTLFSGISQVFQDATEYNNVSQTTKNILATHDRRYNFDGRFANMNQLLRQVGVETKFTAPQVAEAGKFLAMAGLNIEQIKDAIRPITDIALIGDTELGETADVITNIMTGYEIPSKMMSNAADVLTMTFTKTNTTLIELAESFKYAGTIAKQAGLSFETSSAAFGILGNAGIKGSHAGTTLRMMINNMLNPNEKQTEAWKSIGVSTKDSNGNLRNFTDIMSELHEKSNQMSNGEFTSLVGKMFRITALPGALALINNADQIKDITDKNYNSMGISSNLAEEKKNTIQGLWYQMTSAFTETGMQGFESMQSVIKDFLIRMTKLMKSSEFATALRDMMNLFINIMDYMTKTVKMFANIWSNIPQFMKDGLGLFIKMQLFSSTIAGIGKSLLSTFLLLRGVLLGHWLSSFINAIVAIKPFLEHLRSLYLIGTAAGGMSPVKSLLSTIAYGVFKPLGTVGVAGGTGATSIIEGSFAFTPLGVIGKLLSCFFSLPGAIFGAVTALGVIGYQIWDTIEVTKEAAIMNEKWSESFRNLGVEQMKITSSDDLMIANMRIYNNELTDHQTKINQSANAWHRYWIERNGPKTEQQDNTKFIDTVEGGGFMKNLKAADAWFNIDESFKDVIKSLGGVYTTRNIIGRDGKASKQNVLMVNGQQLLLNSDKSLTESAAVQLSLAQLGADPNNKQRLALEKYLLTSATSATSSVDLINIINNARQSYLPKFGEWDSKYDRISSEEAEELSRNNIDNSQANMRALRKNMEQVFATWNDFSSLLHDVDSGQEISPLRIQSVLQDRFGWLFDIKGGKFGSDEWFDYVKKETEGKPSDEITGYITETFDNLLSWYELLSTKYKPLFANYLNRSVFEQLLPDAKRTPLGNGGFYGGTKEGDKKTINGILYTWKRLGPGGDLAWRDDKGNVYTPNNAKQEWDNGTITNSIHNGSDQSVYKDHYKNSSAAPKQIIVKIENLMRVDQQSIDMNDGRQVAAINNIKQELATALLDVVQDFNANIV